MDRTLLFRLALLAIVLAVAAVGIAWRDELDIATVRTAFDDLGVWAPALFMGAYALGAVAFLPGMIFTVAGGALFGPLWGTLYSLLGATAGATLAFLAARHAAADWVAQRSGGMLKRVIVGVEREGWRFVVFTRLIPVFPFNLLNYALGLTRIPLGQYVLATFVAMAPGALAYVWLGHAGAEALAGGEQTIQVVLIALGLLAAVWFLPRLVRRIRRDPVPGIDTDPDREDSAERPEGVRK